MKKSKRYEKIVNLSAAFLLRPLIGKNPTRNLWTIYSILKGKIRKSKKVKSEKFDDKQRSSKAVAILDESESLQNSRSENIVASDKNKQTEKTKERRKKKKEKWAIVKEGNHVHEGKGHSKAIRYMNYNFKPKDWFV